MTAAVLRARTGRLLPPAPIFGVERVANDTRIPSIAEDVATEVRTLRRRTARSRRYGFEAESLVLMRLVYQESVETG